MWVQSVSWEDLLEKEMATHSSILAWKIAWTQDPMMGYSPWGWKQLDTIEHVCTDPHFTGEETKAPQKEGGPMC